MGADRGNARSARSLLLRYVASRRRHCQLSDDLPDPVGAVLRLLQMMDDALGVESGRPVGHVRVTTMSGVGHTTDVVAGQAARDRSKTIALIMLRSQVRFLLAPPNHQYLTFWVRLLTYTFVII